MNQLTLTFTTLETSIKSDKRCQMLATLQEDDSPNAKPVKIGGMQSIRLFLDGNGVLQGDIRVSPLVGTAWEPEVHHAAPGLRILRAPAALMPDLALFYKALEAERGSVHVIFVNTPLLGNMQLHGGPHWESESAETDQCIQGIQGYWEGIPVILGKDMASEWVFV